MEVNKRDSGVDQIIAVLDFLQQFTDPLSKSRKGTPDCSSTVDQERTPLMLLN